MNNISNNSQLLANKMPEFDLLWSVLIKVDIGFRCWGVSSHLIFLLVLIGSRSLQKRTFLFANHATLVNTFYVLNMFSYIWNDHPSFDDANLNNVLCSMSEISWIFSSYIRSYSLLLLAVYRYLATFKLATFKRLNKSKLNLTALICLCWLLAFGFPLIAKYSLGTTNSYTFCLDGYSPDAHKTIIYYVYVYTTVILVPVPFVIAIYFKINRKLNSLAVGTRQQQQVVAEANKKKTSRRSLESQQLDDFELDENDLNMSWRSETSHENMISRVKLNKKIDKQRTFSMQFIFMCISLVSSSFVLTIFQLRSVIPNFFSIFYYWRPVLRCYMNVALSIVPWTSIYFHPKRSEFIQKLKNKIFTK